MRKSFWMFSIMAGFLAVLPAAAADFPAPDALAKSVTDEVLAVVRADKDIQAGDPKKVLDLVEAKVLPHFHFMRMTQLAMGKHWRQASAEERQVLTREFRALLVRTYTAAFTQYKDQKVEYRPLRLAPEDNDVVVKSLVKRSSGPPVAVDYRMEKTGAGWKVYDVKIEGASLIEAYRGSFNTEVQKHGVGGLIKTLATKNGAPGAQQQAEK
jgi:phospholipid transport system substrate-binding protein